MSDWKKALIKNDIFLWALWVPVPVPPPILLHIA
jgi:hypothetical protein